MNKNIKIFVVPFVFAIIAVLIYFAFFFNFAKNSIAKKDINTITDAEIIEVLKTNTDVSDYIGRNSDFSIVNKEILTKDNILKGKNGKSFQPVYEGLNLEDNRYMKVDLTNAGGNEGYMTVIDFNDMSVQKAFGLLLFQGSANLNSESGQEAIAP